MRIIEVFASGIAVLLTLLVCVIVAGCNEATAESESPNLDVIATAETGREAPSEPPRQTTAVENDEGQPEETTEAATVAAPTTRPPREETRPRPTPIAAEVGTAERPQRAERDRRREEPSPALEPEIVETEGIGVRHVTLARSIEDRTPVDPGTTFAVEEGGRIYAYLEVNNPDREERELSVAWARVEDPEDELSRVEVQVGAHPRWRTWAYTSRLTQPGRYMAIVRDHDGEVIARAPFEVTM